MRLVRQTPSQLVLLHRPVLLSTTLAAGALLLLAVCLWNVLEAEWLKAGLAFLCTGGLVAPALWFATERVDVEFDANAQVVTIETRRLNGHQSETHPLNTVERAMLQTHKGPSDTAGAHRVALVFHPGDLADRRPLTTGYTGGRAMPELVARINGWLDAARATDPT